MGGSPEDADPQNLAPRQLECYCKFVKEKVAVAPASAFNNMDPGQGKKEQEGSAQGFKETGVALLPAERAAPAVQDAIQSHRFRENEVKLVDANAEEELTMDERDMPARAAAAASLAAAQQQRFRERSAELSAAAAARAPPQYAAPAARAPAPARDPYEEAPELTTDFVEQSAAQSDPELEAEIEMEQEEMERYRREMVARRRAHQLRLARMRERFEGMSSTLEARAAPLGGARGARAAEEW